MTEPTITVSHPYAEGMPRPMTLTGQRQWDRASIDAWLGRHHPQALGPANDPAGPPEPVSRQAWRSYLDRYFGHSSATPGPGKGHS